MPKHHRPRRTELFLAVDPRDIVDERALNVPPPAPMVRADPSFDFEAAVDAVRLIAVRLGAHLVTLRTELERAPLPDADPERDRGAISRIAILEHAMSAAETWATSLCLELGSPVPRLCTVERMQIEASGAEAMLVLFVRELDRAPWDASDGRLALLGELVRAGHEAARLVRCGLGAIADRMLRAPGPDAS